MKVVFPTSPEASGLYTQRLSAINPGTAALLVAGETVVLDSCGDNASVDVSRQSGLLSIL